MAIVEADLLFVASERMIDSLSTTTGIGGGGKRGTAIVQDGVSNEVFPDVMPADRITGRVQTRLIYPSVLSADNDRLANAHACVLERPTDPLVEVCAMVVGASGAAGTRAYDAVASLQTPFGVTPAFGSPENGTIDGSIAKRLNVTSHPFQVGDYVHLKRLSPALEATWRKVEAVNATWFEFAGTTPFATSTSVRWDPAAFTSRRLSAAALTTGALSATDTVIPVDRVEVRVIPVGASASTPGLVSAEYLTQFDGKAPAFVAGDLALIQHASTPATWEVGLIESVDYLNGEVRLVDGLANAYTTGAKVATLLPLGDLQAGVVGSPFTLQQWVRTWADSPSGPAISANYSGAIALTNEGAIEDRWAIVFKTTTTFDLLSERFGQLASGSIGTNFMPLNPMTSEPFFTLFASGWGSGWLPGNTLRFNTRAASAPLWMAQCVSPGAASGALARKAFIYGDVDA